LPANLISGFSFRRRASDIQPRGGTTMTTKRILIVLLFFFFSAGVLAFAAGPPPKDETFGLFFADFQKAVASGDKEKVAGMINFENFTWEENENLRQVKTKEAFLKNYDAMFTATIKRKIAAAAGRPTKVDDNTYFLNWYANGNEYTLDFTRKKGEKIFKFHGLTIGPA
jgi:hypothetical protein